MATSTAWMVEGKTGGAELGRATLMLVPSAYSRIGENNLKIGGAELGRAILMLELSADPGIGECNLVNAVSRL